MNLNLSSYVRAGKNIVTANSPMLLVGAAVTGVITTGILAARSGYKARGIIDEAELEKGDLLTLQEKVQLTWLTFAAPGVACLSTVASVIGLHTVHTKRFNAMAGLYAVSVTKLDEYAEQAEELLGAKKSQQLNDKIAQRNLDGAPIVDDREIYRLPGEGKELCHDASSGRLFQGSISTIELALAKLNTDLHKHGEANLNEFYAHLGVPEIQQGPLSNVGWSMEKLEGGDIDLRFGSATTSDGRPAISFWFHTKPTVL